MASKTTLPSLSDREGTILAVLINHSQKGLYGANIRTKVKEEHGVSIALGSLYVTLGRLIDKGFLERVDGEVVSENKNLRRQYYRITRSGTEALKAKAEMLRGFQRLAWGSAA